MRSIPSIGGGGGFRSFILSPQSSVSSVLGLEGILLLLELC